MILAFCLLSGCAKNQVSETGDSAESVCWIKDLSTKILPEEDMVYKEIYTEYFSGGGKITMIWNKLDDTMWLCYEVSDSYKSGGGLTQWIGADGQPVMHEDVEDMINGWQNGTHINHRK